MKTCANLNQFCAGDNISNSAATVGSMHAMLEEESALKISAYPNPFKTSVQFVITSPVSGQATLEVYNSVGQRVKTVYKGYLIGGANQKVDFTMPGTSGSNLIYVLRMGNRQVSGKLIKLH